jgi:hypothetical protein
MNWPGEEIEVGPAAAIRATSPRPGPYQRGYPVTPSNEPAYYPRPGLDIRHPGYSARLINEGLRQAEQRLLEPDGTTRALLPSLNADGTPNPGMAFELTGLPSLYRGGVSVHDAFASPEYQGRPGAAMGRAALGIGETALGALPGTTAGALLSRPRAAVRAPASAADQLGDAFGTPIANRAGQADLFPDTAPRPLRAYHGTYEDVSGPFAPFSHFGTPQAAESRLAALGDGERIGEGGVIHPVDIFGKRVDVGEELPGNFSTNRDIADLLHRSGHITDAQYAHIVEPFGSNKFLGEWPEDVALRRLQEATDANDIGAIGYRNAIEDAGSRSYLVPNPERNVRPAFGQTNSNLLAISRTDDFADVPPLPRPGEMGSGLFGELPAFRALENPNASGASTRSGGAAYRQANAPRGDTPFHDPRLTPDQSFAVQQRLNGYTPAEIAGQMDTSPNVVRVHLNNARKRAPDLDIPRSVGGRVAGHGALVNTPSKDDLLGMSARGLTDAQIAERTGLTQANVKVRLWRYRNGVDAIAGAVALPAGMTASGIFSQPSKRRAN